MLKTISLENFKGIGEPVQIDLKPITLLFGPNSAGKSTILQSLLYALEVLERQNTDADYTEFGDDAVNLGGFQNIIHRRELNRSVTLGFSFGLEKFGNSLPAYSSSGAKQTSSIIASLALFGPIKTAAVEFDITYSNKLGKPICTRYQVALEGDELATIEFDLEELSAELTHLNFDHPLLLSWDERSGSEENEDSNEHASQIAEFSMLKNVSASGKTSHYGNLILKDLDSALPNWVRGLDIDHILSEEDLDNLDYPYDLEVVPKLAPVLSQAIVGPGARLLSLLRELLYLGPLREVPERTHVVPKTERSSRWAKGLAAWDLLHADEGTLVATANDWLSSEYRLNTGYGMKRSEFIELQKTDSLFLSLKSNSVWDDFDDTSTALDDYEIKRRIALFDLRTHIDVQPRDVGIGISQIVPVIVAALQKEFTTALIEQPELHVHPAVQIGLGDLFIEGALQRNKLLLVETHSEHLLLRILRRIREESDTILAKDSAMKLSDQISIVYMEQADGEVRCENIRVDESGDFIDEWPKGFFEERYQELVRR